MYRTKNFIGIALVSASFLFTPMVASSEPAYGSPTDTQAPTAAPRVDDTTVDKFVVAFADVRDLQLEFSRKLETADSPDKAQALQQEAQQKMVSAVEEAGLSVADYNQVVTAMEQNPELRDEILSRAQ